MGRDVHFFNLHAPVELNWRERFFSIVFGFFMGVWWGGREGADRGGWGRMFFFCFLYVWIEAFYIFWDFFREMIGGGVEERGGGGVGKGGLRKNIVILKICWKNELFRLLLEMWKNEKYRYFIFVSQEMHEKMYCYSFTFLDIVLNQGSNGAKMLSVLQNHILVFIKK
jgi:hypothetical protein